MERTDGGDHNMKFYCNQKHHFFSSAKILSVYSEVYGNFHTIGMTLDSHALFVLGPEGKND